MNDSDSNGRRGRSRRSFLAAASGGVATATSLAGCSSPSDAGTTADASATTDDGARTTTERAETGTTAAASRPLRVASEPPATLDPVAAVDDVSKQVVSQCYEGLLAHPDGTVAVEPALARAVSVSDDHQTYEFELREARFHDGRPVTAEDVAFSLERVVASPNSAFAQLLNASGVNLAYDVADDGTYVPGSIAVAAVDERTVRLRVVKPFAWTLAVLALPALAVVPRGVVGDVDAIPAGTLADDETEAVGDGERAYGAFATEEPVGTGPFELDARDEDGIRLTRFADYHGTTAGAASVEYRTFEDSTAAYEHAVDAEPGGEPDVFPIPRAAFERAALYTAVPDANGRVEGTYDGLPSGERLRYQATPALHTEVLCLNAERVSRPVRRALADVLRQRTLVADAFDGRAKPAVHLAPPALYPGGAAAYREHADAYPYGTGESRVADARDRLDAAGFDEASPATVTLVRPADRDGEPLRAHLREAVDPVPVELETRTLTDESFEEAARNGRLDAFPRRVDTPTASARDVLVQAVPALTNTDPSIRNYLAIDWDWDGQGGGVTDAAERYESAWQRYADAQAPTEAARARRIHAAVEMEEALWTDVPVIPLYHRVHERFHRERVDVPAFGALGPPAQTLDDVAVEADRAVEENSEE